MRSFCIACALVALTACVPNAAPGDGPSSRTHAPALTPFGSDEAFTRYQQRMESDWQARVLAR